VLKKALWLLIGFAAVAAGVALAGYFLTTPQSPPENSASAHWLLPGRYHVGETTATFVDASRPTKANGSFKGNATRQFDTVLWYPTNADGAHPLIVYSHGFMSNRRGGEYIARLLASHGYIVVAANFPLTYRYAPGGPTVTDVVNQPADVSFLIDEMLALKNPPFEGTVDATRIGAMGLSLGGLTTTLATFHPSLADPRIRAAVSMAGPSYMLTTDFFDPSGPPFLMIAGTLDAIVEHASNAETITTRAPTSGLISIEGGSHISFTHAAEPWLRWAANPDSFGCRAIVLGLGDDLETSTDGTNPLAELGDVSQGVDLSGAPPGLCSHAKLADSIPPGRQQFITNTAIHAFFESVFAGTADRKVEATHAWQDAIQQDYPEVSVTLGSAFDAPEADW